MLLELHATSVLTKVLTLPDPTSPMMVVSDPDGKVSEISFSVFRPESTDQLAYAFVN